MNYKDLIYTVSEQIATITLNRPDRMNSLSANLEHELHHAFDAADADASVKVIILTGSGHAFCSGRDQDVPPGGTRMTDPKGKTHTEFIAQWHRSDTRKIGEFTHMWRLGKPIIAAVNGWALGAGFWYQLAADITIAPDPAGFAQPEGGHTPA